MKYATSINKDYSFVFDKIREHIGKNCPDKIWILDNIIFLHLAGSHLYGTNTKDSDLDIRGITIAPKSYWVGAKVFDKPFEMKCEDPELDIVIYDVRHWLKLATAMNPNVIETLFVKNKSLFIKDKSIIINSFAWNDNLDNTGIYNSMLELVNKQAYFGYSGYSTSQLKKLQTKQSNKTGRQYISEEFGFDTKFASHGFRLLRQGKELLDTGKITFPRPDAQNLMDIRYGKIYGPKDLEKCLSDHKKEHDDLTKAYQESKLPDKADFEKYNNLLETIYDTQVDRKI